MLASMSTINLILASCSQPYQPTCSSDSCGDNLKVLLNFKTVHWEKTKCIYKFICKKVIGNVIQ